MRGVFRSVQHEKVPHQGEFNGSVPTAEEGVGWDVDWLFFSLLISDIEQTQICLLMKREMIRLLTGERWSAWYQYSTDWYVHSVGAL